MAHKNALLVFSLTKKVKEKVEGATDKMANMDNCAIHESNSNEQCQILVRVVEARQLIGNDIDPFVQVTVGQQIKATKTKRSANDVVFEEDFVFDFSLPKVVFLQNIISITVFSDGGLFRANKTVGCFKIDAATVHAQPGQGFFRKWAMLLDPDDPMGGPKGYVKCDILATVADGAKRPSKPPAPPVDEDDIEGNLLVPDESAGSFGERQPAKFVVSIFRAESLPSLNNSAMFSSMKKALVGQGPKALVNPYVHVSFAGRSGKTRVIKHNANPEWNQEIIFVELFPALVKTIRIHLRDEAGSVLATTLIDLDKISDNGPAGFLPTFGPAFVNLYGEYRSYIDHSPLNYGLGEGVAYRGRLCMAVRVELLEFFPRKGMHKVDVLNCPPPTEDLLGEWQDFTLFGTIFDADMIEKKYANKSLHFELSLGEFGCFEEGQSASKSSAGKSKSMESLLDSERSSGIASSISGSITTLANSTSNLNIPASLADGNASFNVFGTDQSSNIDKTVPKKSTAAKGDYCHVSYGPNKPYFNISLSYQHHMRRYRDASIMKRICKTLETCLADIEKLFSQEEDEQSNHQVPSILLTLTDDLKKAISSLSEPHGDSVCIHTDLDRYRRKQRINNLEQAARHIEKLVQEQEGKEIMHQLSKISEKMRILSHELQECLPDTFLWLCHHNKRIGYKRFRAHEILFLQEEVNKFRLQTFFLKPPPVEGVTGNTGSTSAVITGYFWLSLSCESSSLFQGLPDLFTIGINGERFLHYSDSHNYQLRCYLFQGRSLIGSDDSGLSDPFVRIVFKENVMESQTIEQTISPVWDETLVFPPVILYGSSNYYLDNPPKIIMQVYDYDKVGKCEFLGQTETHPIVKLATEPYSTPKFPSQLRSCLLYRGPNEDVGDVMACFELIQISFDMEPCPELPLSKSEKSKIIPLPSFIKPVLKPYYFEVFFWGVRDLKPAGMLPIEEPSIEVECGGHLVRSGPLKAVKKLPNFQSSGQKIKIFLPENPLYRPPLNIRCVDKKTFGRFVLVGTCTVANIEQFMIKGDQGRIGNALSMETLAGDIDDSVAALPDAKLKSLSTSALETIQAEERRESVRSSSTEITTSSTVKTLSSQKEMMPLQKQQQRMEKQVDFGSKQKLFDEERPLLKMKEVEENEECRGNLLDWWSKYYASIRAMEESSKLSSTMESTILTIVNETQTSKKGKKRRFFKSKVKAVTKFIRPRPPKKAPGSSEHQDDKTELLQIFPCELENVADFNSFHDCFYPFTLTRGKKSFNEADEAERAVGKFKGLVSITQVKQGDQEGSIDENPVSRMSNDAVKVLVRVYVVQAKNLRPCDPTGKADPYLTLQCGNTKISDKQNRIYCQLNPVFGRMFEFEASIPEEYELTVRVFDWDRLSADDLMGETKIDLEQRFYSKHRASCGFQSKYETKGYNSWRDSSKPTQILSKLCRQYGVTGPFYGHSSITIGTKKFQMANDESEGMAPIDNENLALYALRNWQDMPYIGYCLVPEHVETRNLYLPDKPGMEQGSLEMWLDIFPLDGPSPPIPVDITPRKPNGYQLRIIIWDTKNVVLDDYNAVTGQSSVDQYIKGFVIGPKIDLQQTDVHYRSLNGEGNFNWRFLFNFDYSEAEEKIIYKTKESMFSLTEHEEKVLPRVNLQLWDADIITADDYLGTLSFDLTKIPTGAKSHKLCTLDVLNGKSTSFISKQKTSEINLFKAKRTRGWWPFIRMEGKDQIMTGKVDVELQILTAAEAEKKAAGLGRDPPDPMPQPQRPETSFAWFSSPLKMLKYDIWIGMRWRCLQIFLILLFALFFALFIYQLPQSVAERMVLG